MPLAPPPPENVVPASGAPTQAGAIPDVEKLVEGAAVPAPATAPASGSTDAPSASDSNTVAENSGSAAAVAAGSGSDGSSSSTAAAVADGSQADVVQVPSAEPDGPKPLLGRSPPGQVNDDLPRNHTPIIGSTSKGHTGHSSSNHHHHGSTAHSTGGSSGTRSSDKSSSSFYGEPGLRGSAAAYVTGERSPSFVANTMDLNRSLDTTSVLAGVFLALMALMFVRRCRASVLFSRGLVSVAGTGKSSPAVSSQTQSAAQSSDVRELIKAESEIRVPKLLNSGVDRKSLLSDDNVRKILRFIPPRYAAVRLAPLPRPVSSMPAYVCILCVSWALVRARVGVGREWREPGGTFLAP